MKNNNLFNIKVKFNYTYILKKTHFSWEERMELAVVWLFSVRSSHCPQWKEERKEASTPLSGEVIYFSSWELLRKEGERKIGRQRQGKKAGDSYNHGCYCLLSGVAMALTTNTSLNKQCQEKGRSVLAAQRIRTNECSHLLLFSTRKKQDLIGETEEKFWSSAHHIAKQIAYDSET